MSKQLEIVVRENYRTPDDLEKVLMLLREHGASQMESVKLLCNVLNYNLREADRAVLHSLAWRDQRSGTNRLRDKFFDALDEGN